MAQKGREVTRSSGGRSARPDPFLQLSLSLTRHIRFVTSTAVSAHLLTPQVHVTTSRSTRSRSRFSAPERNNGRACCILVPTRHGGTSPVPSYAQRPLGAARPLTHPNSDHATPHTNSASVPSFNRVQDTVCSLCSSARLVTRRHTYRYMATVNSTVVRRTAEPCYTRLRTSTTLVLAVVNIGSPPCSPPCMQFVPSFLSIPETLC